ncbi:ATP-binding cassette domain-containing protein [Bordetella bronchialis]|uniref:ATP-binding protein n=1 Tax=Bordetella bronchialis TaxID=463025 RepID=A0A193FV41_9BORD|nr:ABC transporter ATP-binding protein [Bordetella bronchialis]ANN65962.1 ATP-binding protein [Bordetella bronchialis]ANN71046.1 ATP-binding protein [Bordetella bronchialis]
MPLLQLSRLSSPRLEPVDLDCEAGECHAIQGPSGSGKSVLLRLIADLDPGAGTAALRGVDRSRMSGPQWRRQVVYCQAEAGWWHEAVAPHFPDRQAAIPFMERLGVAPAKLDAMVHELSTGERQRLGLIRALLLKPPLLLLDEPTAALDAHATLQVEQEIRARLRDGAAVLLVTHSPEQAGRLATHFWRMGQGRLERQP